MTELNLSTLSGKNSSPSSLSSHISIFNDNHNHHLYSIPIHSQQQGNNDFNLGGGSYNIEYDSENESGLKFSIWKKQVTANSSDENLLEERNGGFRVKWMSSKMRLMHKMRNNNNDPTVTNHARLMKREFEEEKNHDDHLSFDQMGDSNTSIITSSSNNATIRVCSDCNTTKTPLWRSGPCGPKSLCNACGIRQRKARRAMIATSTATPTATNETVSVTERSPALINFSKSKQKEKRANESKYKKRCKIASTTYSRKELRFEEFLLNLSKKLSLHRMFPQDEKEAAILLMALSCGNIHG